MHQTLESEIWKKIEQKFKKKIIDLQTKILIQQELFKFQLSFFLPYNY